MLWLLHLFLALTRFFKALAPRRLPKDLKSRRRKLPGHLAVILSECNSGRTQVIALEDALETARRLIDWSRQVGIHTLSIFDENSA